MRILVERTVRFSWGRSLWDALFYSTKPIRVSQDLLTSQSRTSGPAWEGYSCVEFYA